jgi:cysteinyl-tRNA synthetase
MSLKYLGDTLDIHGGGQDLVFPHHENEIAQSESFTGKKPFVKYWLHNGMVQFGEEKMSKSLGNLITIKEALTKHSADAIRIFILNSHYRSPLTYLEESFEAAEKAAERLRQAARSETGGEKGEGRIDVDTYRSQFVTAMDDDFNTARALATLFDLAREINRAVESGYRVASAQKMLVELGGILGLTFKPPGKPVIDAGLVARIRDSVYQEINRVVTAEAAQTAEELIEELISLRNQLRQDREWQLADMVRSKLDEAGITLEDTPRGTVAKYRR